MKKMMTGVLALVMVLVMVGCGQKDNGVVNGVAKDGATIGEGAKSFTTEVVDKDGGKVTFTVKTDADTVGKALLDQGVSTLVFKTGKTSTTLNLSLLTEGYDADAKVKLHQCGSTVRLSVNGRGRRDLLIGR